MGKFKFGKDVYTKTVRIPLDWDVMEMYQEIQQQMHQESTPVKILPDDQDECDLSTL